MWPGYLVAVKSLNDGVFLNIDTVTKFLSMETVFDKIRALQKKKYSREEIKKALLEENGPLVVILPSTTLSSTLSMTSTLR